MLTKGEIRKLRRASHDFSLNQMPEILHAQLVKYGIDTGLFEIVVPNTEISDQDPEIVFVNYESVFADERYLPDRVQVEIGARSLNEPFSVSSIGSIIDETFPDSEFAEETFGVKSIIPEKTYLEKIILLHEEFQKPVEKIRSQRMSRHLYDIHSIHNSEYGDSAMKDEELFRSICTHRAVFTPVRQKLRDQQGQAIPRKNQAIPRKNVLLSPWLDVSMSNPDIDLYRGKDVLLHVEGLKACGKLYAGNTELKDPMVSPIFGNLEHISNIKVFVSSHELFYPDCKLLAENAKTAEGTDIELRVKEKMVHDWAILPIRERDETIAEIAAFLLHTK